MKKLKVLTVVGTRPEIIRLSRVLARLDEHCDHVLVHTGQNYDYELNQVFFDDLGVRKPDYFLNSAEGSSGAAHTIGNLIIAVDQVLADVQPEAPTAAYRSFRPNGARFLFFTWRQETAVLTSACRKKPTAASWTTRPM